MAREDAKVRSVALTAAALRLGVMVLPRVPTRVKRFLAGGRKITIDGNTLDATAHLLLAAQRLSRTGGLGASGDPETARALMRNSHVAMAPKITVPTTDRVLPGPGGDLRTRHYRPAVAARPPLLVFFHGGGFVLGDIESHDGLCRMICRDAAIQVLSVDYRLAPEHKAPAAVEDCLAAYQWALEHAADLGADPTRIGIGGDSAGGTLAALVTLQCRDQGILQPTLQVLLYPALNMSGETRSRALFSDGFFVSKAENDWFTDSFLGGTEYSADDPRVSPLKADLTGLAPALVFTGGFDPLRDEGDEYAASLRAAGVPVEHRQFGSLPHGFASIAPLGGDSAVAIADTIAAIGNYFGGRAGSKESAASHL